MPDAMGLLSEQWFARRDWQPFPFQQEVWHAIDRGESGLLHATTGSGKTYAVWLGALNRFATKAPSPTATDKPAPLTVLWITPMRALAADTARALQAPLDDLGIDEATAASIGLCIYKVAMTWPLEMEGARAFSEKRDPVWKGK